LSALFRFASSNNRCTRVRCLSSWAELIGIQCIDDFLLGVRG
jgi:hypothetical protein